MVVGSSSLVGVELDSRLYSQAFGVTLNCGERKDIYATGSMDSDTVAVASAEGISMDTTRATGATAMTVVRAQLRPRMYGRALRGPILENDRPRLVEEGVDLTHPLIYNPQHAYSKLKETITAPLASSRTIPESDLPVEETIGH